MASYFSTQRLFYVCEKGAVFFDTNKYMDINLMGINLKTDILMKASVFLFLLK